MANVFLTESDSLYNVANSNVHVYGAEGDQVVNIEPGATDVILDQNVEGVELSGNLADYEFLQKGNVLNIYSSDGTLLAEVPVQMDDNGTQIIVGGQTYNAMLESDGTMKLGDYTVSNTSQEPVVQGPNVTITAASNAVTEGNSDTFTVTIDKALDHDLVLTYAIQGDGSNPASDADFSHPTGQITIPAGQTSVTFTLTPVDDGVKEGDEEFKVVLKDSNGNTVATSSDITIHDATGETYTLTTGQDQITGTQYNDTFNAVVSSLSSENTLNANDQIDGGKGDDVMNIDLKSSFAGFDSTGYIKNIETIKLTNDSVIDRTFDAKNITGVQKYVLNGGDNKTAINLSDLAAAGITVAVQNVNDNFSIGFSTDTDLSGTSDAMTLDLSGVGTDTSAVSITMNGIEDVTINTSDAPDYVDLTNLANATSLTVSGDQNIDIKAVDANLQTFDASGEAGNVTADLSGANSIDTVKTGSGDDVITMDIAKFVANGTIDMGGGNDTLKISDSAGSTVQPTMQGVDTVEITGVKAGAALTFSAVNTHGLNTIQVDANATNNGAVDFVNLGTADIHLVENGGLAATQNVTLDNSGITTIDLQAPSDASATVTNNGNIELTQSQNVTLNVDKYIDAAGTYTFDKATAVTLNVDSAVVNDVEQTVFSGTLNAPEATNLTVNAKGDLGTAAAAATLAAASATSVTFNTDSLANVVINAPKATDLTIDAKGAFTAAAGSNLSGVQAAAITADGKDATITLTNAPLLAIHSLTLGGDGAITLSNLGTDGTNVVDYDVNITATGVDHGLTFGDVGTDQDLTMNLAGVKGTITGGALTGTNVTVNANGLAAPITLTTTDAYSADHGTATFNFENAAGNITLGNIGSTHAFENVTVDASGAAGTVGVGTIDAAGQVTVNASGALNDVTVGAITANDVTLDFTNALKDTTVGAITVSDSFTAKAGLNAINAAVLGNAVTVDFDNTTNTTFTADLTGSIKDDHYDFAVQHDNDANITIKGDLGIQGTGTQDSVVVNAAAITTATHTATVDLSGLAGYETSTITGGAGGDKIHGGGGLDLIDGGDGNDGIVVIGKITTPYSASDIAGSIAGSMGLAPILESTKATSDVVQGETINGGIGMDTLEVWGDVDLTKANISGIESINTHSDVSIDASQLLGDFQSRLVTGLVNFNLLDSDTTVTLKDVTGVTLDQVMNLYSALKVTDFNFDNVSALVETSNGYKMTASDYYTGATTTLGNAGYTDNHIIWGYSSPVALIINGGEGSDIIFGSIHEDSIFGGRGDDIIFTDGGDDKVNGYEGVNTLIVDGYTDTYDSDIENINHIIIDASSGGNYENFSHQTEKLNVSVYNGTTTNGVTVITGKGNDHITGGVGDDTIHGGNGSDYIDGGLGNDIIYGDGGSDIIKSGEGSDKIALDHFSSADKIVDFVTGVDGLYVDIAKNSAGANATNKLVADMYAASTKVNIFAVSNGTKIAADPASKAVNGSISNNMQLTSKELLIFNGKISQLYTAGGNKLNIKDGDNNTNANNTATKLGILFVYTAPSHKLYMIGVKDASRTNLHLSATKLYKTASGSTVKYLALATITDNSGGHNTVSATDIHIF